MLRRILLPLVAVTLLGAMPIIPAQAGFDVTATADTNPTETQLAGFKFRKNAKAGERSGRNQQERFGSRKDRSFRAVPPSTGGGGGRPSLRVEPEVRDPDPLTLLKYRFDGHSYSGTSPSSLRTPHAGRSIRVTGTEPDKCDDLGGPVAHRLV